MKKKVGLITYHASHNIGSMLQTYALQYILNKQFNCDVEIINFSSKAQANMYSIFPKVNNLNTLVKNGINLLAYPIVKARFDDFERFINKHFTLTANSYDELKQLDNLDGYYDYLICGSDQIWNVNCTDFDDAYFLPFAPNTPKIAYAPSLGGQNILKSNIDLDKYKKYLKEFKALSVREVNGKKWLEELSNEKFEIVADPTILVNRDVWEKLATPREFEGDYIFFYGVPFSPITYDIVMEISKKLNLNVVMMDAKSWLYKGNFLKGIKLSKASSPSDYLSLIKHSKLVITTSFHGSIFASIFNKNFWTVTYKETNLDDDRVKTILTQLEMPERLIYLEEYQDYDLLEDIDYSNYEQNIKLFQEKSLNYLQDAFKES
ncbi:polysaccharide pyruvyl transferase family protein [Paraglaciecola agarilytica]|uniref:polysaccharide pyruvyl transferase family protein n=1 Tax=Paraglaciecola chathamensis TaxID=368405 RepID=UPI001C08ACB3|nr:polysaccharide pyruvyl transferase family protein [Paraglaciecola agarilytica]MBU3016152.1 polysaccharide pyruvyl transferase family protein [Paraglaciecola agarilytica]